MPVSTRDEEIKEKRKDHGYLPYNLSARRAKMWTPSIWNALTFWRGSAASGDGGRESHSKDAPHSVAKSPIPLEFPSTPGGANDISNGAARNESNEAHTHESSFSSNASEGQVSAQLTMERHVHFKLPSSEQQRSDSRTEPITPIQRESRGNYHPPIPPSSLLHRIPTAQNPLDQVAEYCFGRDHLNHVEALGLNSLIQQSVHVDGRPAAAHYPVVNPFLAAVSGSASPSMSMSPSPPPIPPTFTNPNTDVAALLASSATPPSLPHAHVSASEPSPSRSSASPSRRLARNPNGPLYYQGGGSARPRYRSPAFSSSPTRKKVAFPRGFGDSPQKSNNSPSIDSPSPSDGKRRRVGEERESSQALGSAPATPNGINKMPVPPTPPKSLRFVAPSSGSHVLASTPARPSPLRQSVRADSSSPSSAGESPSGRERAMGEGPSRVTASEKASEIMAGIISNATPKKDTVPDVRNPYQAGSRSPTKRARKPTMKAIRPPPRPIRSTESPPPPTAPQPKKLNAFETIQRTAPQTGSKRSHTGMPPPNARGTNGIHAPTPRLSVGKPIVIEISDDEEEEEEQAKHPPAKKQRQEGAEIQDRTEDTLQLEDVDMNEPVADKEKVILPGEVVEPDTPERQTQADGKRPLFGGPFGKKGVPTIRFQSVPKEPSPLRQSFQPDAPSSPPKDRSSPTTFPATTATVSQKPYTSPSAATAPPSPFDPSAKPNLFLQASTSSFAQASTSSSFASPPTLAPPQAPFTPPVMPDATAPSPTPVFPPSSPADQFASVKQKAINALPAALPTFVFAFTSSSTVVSKTQHEAALAAPASEVPKYDFVASAMPTLPKNEIKAFDWSAAGMKPIVKAGWTCGTCLISNDNNASKCVSCESSR